MYLYINGVLDNSMDVSGNIKTDDVPLRIGKQFWWSNTYSYWDGLIDEVKIYNRALDAGEVLEHYNDVGVLGAVPVDKSYARIPDGIGEWIDPIPTPGTPNKLSANEIQTTFLAEEEIEVLPSVIELETSIPVPVEVIVNTTTTDFVTTEIVVPIATTAEIVVNEATTTEPIVEVATTTTPTIIIATTTTVVAEIIEVIEQPMIELIIEPIEGLISIEGSAPVEEAIVEEVLIEEFIGEIEVVEDVVEELVEETPIIEEIITEETPAIEEESIILVDSDPVLDGNNQDSFDNQDSEDNVSE
jgi:hypothetical protein